MGVRQGQYQEPELHYVDHHAVHPSETSLDASDQQTQHALSLP